MELESQDIVRRQLSSQEQLLWTGRPKQGIIFRGMDAFLIPFGLLWTGMVGFATVGMLTHPEGVQSPIAYFIMPLFLGLGLYFLFGRFLVDSAIRRKTYYGLTNERAIIVSGLFQATVKSLHLRSLSDVTISEKGAEGTIMLGPTAPWAAWAQGFYWPGMSNYQTPMFERIEDAKQVFDMILRVQSTQTGR